MSITTDGLRSDKWRPFARQKLAILKETGLMTKNYAVDGYRISLLSMGDINKARITAPPGVVVVSFTDGRYEYRYADQYGGDLQLTASLLPTEGSVPNALFSGPDDIMYHGSSDYYATLGVLLTGAASWYAPRAKFAGDPTTVGYLSGGFLQSETSPATTQMVGHGLARAGACYSTGVVMPTATRWFDETSIRVVRAAASFLDALPLSTQYPGFRGKAQFLRPVWGADATLLYVVHNGGACSGVLGAAHVLVYRQETSTAPFGSGGTQLVGQVTQGTMAAALGLPVPCGVVEADTTTMVNAVTDLLGPDWPLSAPPHIRGSFGYGADGVCFWGPLPSAGAVKGVVFSPGGTADVLDIVLPPYDNMTHQPVIAETSPGYYVCELLDPVTYEFQAVYYGSPFAGWTKLDHPPGAILRHRTIRATATEIKALALVFDAGATTLYEYGSLAGAVWIPRGKVADNKIEFADVAIFGNHTFAHLASQDSPARGLWAY